MPPQYPELADEEFFIAFHTRTNPARVEAVRIRIDFVTIPDLDRPLNIGLCDHPLYSDLETYVLENRSK